jgi:type IV secretory pathway protease TraF
MKANFALGITSTALLALVTLRWCGVDGNLTNSEPAGLYVRTLRLPTRGALVELRPLIKHLAGVPGDTVTVTSSGSYINGKLWPHSAIPKDTHGYVPFRFGTYKLQPNQYWILGDSPDSLDSRYLGMISADVIATTIKPLWTISNGYVPGTRP